MISPFGSVPATAVPEAGSSDGEPEFEFVGLLFAELFSMPERSLFIAEQPSPSAASRMMASVNVRMFFINLGLTSLKYLFGKMTTGEMGVLDALER
ncbi:MAG: hypothetical protein UZ17_ACD001001019, partial [Acidobacteria bacterium OLB17]